MSRTEELEQQARKRRRTQSAKLQDWATELRELADQLWDEDEENGWRVRYLTEPQLTTLVTIGGNEFARFVRDEAGLIGVFEGGPPQRFVTRQEAFDAAVKRRMAKRGHSG